MKQLRRKYSILCWAMVLPGMAGQFSWAQSGTYPAQDDYVDPAILKELGVPDNFGVFLAPQSGSATQENNVWHFNGTSSFRVDHYDVDGDPARGIFSDTGTHSYADINVGFSKRKSVDHHIIGEAALLANDSAYRGSESGLILERFHSEWNNGESDTPYRLRLGDFFGYLSPRSVQQTLKGINFELQPQPGESSLRHSLLFFSGFDATTYRDIDSGDDWYNAASWLWHFNPSTSASLNFAHQQQDDNDGEKRDQQVFSLAGIHGFSAGGHTLTLEGEWSSMDGESIETGGGDREGDGLFLSFGGRGGEQQRLAYSLTYERYDEDFRPTGSAIISHREIKEGRLSWRARNGLLIDGRWLEHIDGFDSENPLSTRLAGFRINGNIPVFGRAMTLSVDAFDRVQFDRTGQIDIDTQNLDINLQGELGGQWGHRAGLVAHRIEDQIIDQKTDAFELNYTLQRQYQLDSGWWLSVEPGVIFRSINKKGEAGTETDSDEAGLSLGLRLSDLQHDFILNYEQYGQNRNALAEDLDREELGVSYAYRKKRHRMGIEGRIHLNAPDPGEETESSYVGVFYSYDFAGSKSQDGPLTFENDRVTRQDDNFILQSLASGISGDEVDEIVAAQKLGRGVKLGNNLVYEHTVFPRIDLRQRLVIGLKGEELDISAVIVDFNDPNRPDEMQRDYRRVREALLRLLGAPSRTIEQGEFNENLSQDLDARQFVRINEWTTKIGIIRFGIPKRVDGRLRMEILHSRDLPGSPELRWGLESIR